MKIKISDIEMLGKQGKYEEACTIAIKALKNNLDKERVVESLKIAASHLRSECIGLASNKATEFSKELKLIPVPAGPLYDCDKTF